MRRLIVPLYRRLFCRKGYGIHSPFVFDLITKSHAVITPTPACTLPTPLPTRTTDCRYATLGGSSV